jgi:hypothetical protein
MRVFVRLALVVTLVGGCSPRVFVCGTHEDCAGVEGGMCEPNGWCSFPDDECPSLRRYGRWSGDALAGVCVPEGQASGTTGTDDDDGPTSADAATVGSASASLTTADTGDTTSPVDPSASTSGVPGTSTEGGSSTGEPLDPDLVAWYRFEQDDFTAVVIDEVGDHDGACAAAGCPVPVEGVVGMAAQFDGVDDIVHIAAHDGLQVGDELTVALFVRTAPSEMSFRTFAAKAYLDMDSDTWEIGLDGSDNIQFGVSTIDMINPDINIADPTFDVWTHFAGTWDGSDLRFYVDGELAATIAAGLLAQDDHGVTLGGGIDFEADANFLDGALDEVRIYRRMLGDAEIAELAGVRP